MPEKMTARIVSNVTLVVYLRPRQFPIGPLAECGAGGGSVLGVVKLSGCHSLNGSQSHPRQRARQRMSPALEVPTTRRTPPRDMMVGHP